VEHGNLLRNNEEREENQRIRQEDNPDPYKRRNRFNDGEN